MHVEPQEIKDKESKKKVCKTKRKSGRFKYALRKSQKLWLVEHGSCITKSCTPSVEIYHPWKFYPSLDDHVHSCVHLTRIVAGASRIGIWFHEWADGSINRINLPIETYMYLRTTCAYNLPHCNGACFPRRICQLRMKNQATFELYPLSLWLHDNYDIRYVLETKLRDVQVYQQVCAWGSLV